VRVIVHIERLVLEGLAKPEELDRLRAALETELSRVLAAPPWRGAPNSSAPAYRPAVLRRIDLGGGPEVLGRGIAQAALTRMGPARDDIARAMRRAVPPAPEAAR
jgi:hypothetical protein